MFGTSLQASKNTATKTGLNRARCLPKFSFRALLEMWHMPLSEASLSAVSLHPTSLACKQAARLTAADCCPTLRTPLPGTFLPFSV